jgi:hypothetical protein
MTEAGFDDLAVHGHFLDLPRLARVVDDRLAGAGVGSAIRIWEERADLILLGMILKEVVREESIRVGGS